METYGVTAFTSGQASKNSRGRMKQSAMMFTARP